MTTVSMHLVWTVACLAITLASAIQPCVFIGKRHYAVGTRYATSAGNEVEHFANIPYATRDAPFEMPLPVDYTAAGDAFNRENTATHVNPEANAVVAPDQSTGDPSPETLAMFGLPALPANEATCQQLDIYRPADVSPKSPMRVLVFLHGGFMESRAPINYVYKDALRSFPNDPFGLSTILVTVEYSLGAYGWWHEQGIEVPKDARESPITRAFGRYPSNSAIHQTIQALLWVQRNIAYFGGNPNDVTLAGHSSGAAMSNWVHLTLTPSVLQIYGFHEYPIQKFLFMGGSALVFPSELSERVLARQDAVADAVGCGIVPPGIDRIHCMQQVDAKDIQQACTALNATWHPTIDMRLIHGSLSQILGRSLNEHSAWSTKPRVLLTVTSSESSIFCKLIEHHINKNKEKMWHVFGQPESRARTLSTLGHDVLQHNPVGWATKVTSEPLFFYPATVLQQTYTRAGMTVQNVQLDIETNIDVHAFVLQTLNAVCLKNYSMSFATMRRLLNVGSRVVGLKNSAQSFMRYAGDGISSLVSGRIQRDADRKLQKSSSSWSFFSTSTAAKVLPTTMDHQPPSEVPQQAMYRSMSTAQIEEQSMAQANAAKQKDFKRSHSHNAAVKSELSLDLPLHKVAQLKGRSPSFSPAPSEESRGSHSPMLPLQISPASSTDSVRNASEPKGLFGVPHLTQQRLAKLLSDKAIRKLCKVVQRQIQSIGFFHGLDQMVLFNATITVLGVPVRMDMLIDAARGMNFVYPVHSFVMTGTALAANGLSLPPAPVEYGTHFAEFDYVGFVKGFKSLEVNPDITEVSNWVRMFDELDIEPTPRPAMQRTLSDRLFSAMSPFSWNSSQSSKPSPEASLYEGGVSGMNLGGRADREGLRQTDSHEDNLVHRFSEDEQDDFPVHYGPSPVFTRANRVTYEADVLEDIHSSDEDDK